MWQLGAYKVAHQNGKDYVLVFLACFRASDIDCFWPGGLDTFVAHNVSTGDVCGSPAERHAVVNQRREGRRSRFDPSAFRRSCSAAARHS